MVSSNRARLSRKTPLCCAMTVWICPHMFTTGNNIIAFSRKCCDWTGRKAWLVCTSIAGMGCRRCRRQFFKIRKYHCSAIGLPQTIFWVHQNAVRRRLKPLRFLRPLLERLVGFITWVKRQTTKFFSNWINYMLGPTIKRVIIFKA